jgi:putative membrane protein insertion efficiency factor
MKKIVILLIKFYRLFISPLFPPRCRFQPTCSQYALTSIERFGLVTGGAMATKRILSCHPWHMGGYDPVPEASSQEVVKTSETSTSTSSLEQ